MRIRKTIYLTQQANEKLKTISKTENRPSKSNTIVNLISTYNPKTLN